MEDETKKNTNETKKDINKKYVVIFVACLLVLGLSGFYLIKSTNLFSSLSEEEDSISISTVYLGGSKDSVQSISLSPEKIFGGWRVLSHTGNESKLFDVNIDQRTDEVCLTPKFDGSLKIGDTTYTQPTSLKLTNQNGSTSELSKSIGEFCYTLDSRKSLWYKFGEESVIIVGDTSYDSLDTNITQETGFAHLNISRGTSPYDSLILYYPLDTDTSTTTVFDYSPNNVNGEKRSGIVFNSSGFIGGTYNFNVNDYIRIGTDPIVDNMEDQTGKVSYMSWVRPQSTGERLVFAKSNPPSTSNGRWYFGLRSDSKLSFAKSYDTTVLTAETTTTVDNGFWTHIAVTWDSANGSSSNVKFYINGVEDTTRAINTSGVGTRVSDASDQLGYGGEGSRRFVGNLDEGMMFNTTLTAQQILDIFNNQSARYPILGTQLFNDTDVSVTGTENRLNITLTGYGSLLGSNVSVKINGTLINISSSGIINNLEFTQNPHALDINFIYQSGTSNFYTPLIIGNITLDSWTDVRSYGSTNINITEEAGTEDLFAHLNITTKAPYDNLILYMPFDSNVSTTKVYDYSNSHNDGEIILGALLNKSGLYDSAFEFDGDGDRILILETPSLKTRNITVTMWVKTLETDSGFITKGITRESSANRDWEIFCTSSSVLRWRSNRFTMDGPTCPSDGKWHMITGTWDGSTDADGAKLYLDGLNQANDTASSGALNTGHNVSIGGFRPSGEFELDGAIDEVMIFNVSLTKTEILDLFNNQSIRFPVNGNQTFRDQNVSVTGDEDRMNITFAGYKNVFGSNISVQINGSVFNITSSGVINNLEFGTDPNFLNISFIYQSGPFNFYSPLIIGNITIDAFVGAAANDTCSCPVSGNWDVDGSDNCVIVDSCDLLTNDFFCDGSGSFTVDGANITNWDDAYFRGGCAGKIINGGRFI